MSGRNFFSSAQRGDSRATRGDGSRSGADGRGFRGGRGGGFRGGRGGGGGFGSNSRYDDQGPPAEIQELGEFVHPCEGEMVCRSVSAKVPYFNAPVFLSNKTMIGKVDEILGPINEFFFTVKPQEGVVAASFNVKEKVFIGGDKLLPLERFLPKPKAPPGEKRPKRAGAIRGARGGGGGFRGGRGSGRGGGSFGRGGGPPRGGGFRGTRSGRRF